MVLGMNIAITLLHAIIMAFIGALILFLVAWKLFKLKDKSFKTPLKINLIIYAVILILRLIGILSFNLAVISIMTVLIFVIVIVLGIYLIKKHYKLRRWAKAVLVWLVWVIFAQAIGYLISGILGMILVASAV